MREIFDGFLCRNDRCVKKSADNNTLCADCEYCIDSILYAEAMIREDPYYIDSDGKERKVNI